MEASIKKWCVGSPIQSVLDATTALIDEHRISADDVPSASRITMPDDRMHIVDNRDDAGRLRAAPRRAGDHRRHRQLRGRP